MIRTASGRVRLIWRLVVFLVVAFVATGVAVFSMPRGIVWEAGAGLIGVLAASALVLRMDGRGLGALGFHLSRSVPSESLRGLALGVALSVVVALVMALGGAVRWTTEPGTPIGWLVMGATAAGLLVLPAAWEEAVFRGYPLQALAERRNPVWGIALTSILFGSAHLANPHVTMLGATNTGVAGVFLAVVYLKTGSLWWASGAHLGWNWGLGFLTDLPVSGLELIDAPMIEATVSGPEWISGGDFGPEGSLIVTLGFLGAAAACWWGPWLRPEPAAVARAALAFESEDIVAGTPPAEG